MNSSKVVTALVAALFLFSNTAFPQSGQGFINSWVVFEGADEEDGKPEKRAKVELLTSAGRVAYKTETGESGGYLISQIVPGEYVLRITSPGYRVYTAKIYIPNDFETKFVTMLKKRVSKRAKSRLMLTPQNQNLPDEFYQIPEPVRERATIIISGTFGQGRTPCMLRPDGMRVWAVDSWFEVKRAYRGSVSSRIIRINPLMLPRSSYVSEQLKREHKYLVLLNPREEKMKALKTREGLRFWDSLRDEEIIAIMELK